MSVDKIPDHFLIPVSFLYQADAQLRGGGGGTEAGEASFAGRTKKLVQKMISSGWRKALTAGKSANFAFLYKPEHWDEDDESYPPVTPKTDAAEDFLLDVQKGDRLNFSVKDEESGTDIKTSIMDPLVQELSGGKVQRFSLSAAAKKTALAKGEENPLANRLAGKPAKSAAAKTLEGLEPWVPVPDAVVRSVGKELDPDDGDRAIMRALDGAGMQRAKKGTGVIWFDPSQWEAAIGGIGLLPLTDEAEMFQDRLTADAVQGVLPRAMVPKVAAALRPLVQKKP